MAFYEKLKNGSYRIRVSDGFTLTPTGKKKRVYRVMDYTPKGKTEARIIREVEKQAAIFENKVKTGEIVPSKIRFSKCYEEWLASNAAQKLSERTRQDYCMNIRHYGFPAFGNKEMDKITSRDCENLIVKLKKGHAPATVHKIVASINAVFDYAKSSVPPIIKDNPLASRKLPSLTDKEQKKRAIHEEHTFTVDQARRFLRAIREPYKTTCTRYSKQFTEERTMPLQLQCFYYLAIYGGFRRGELLALTWKDLDFKNRIIDIHKSASPVRTGQKDKNGRDVWEQIIKPPKTVAGNRKVTVPKECFTLLRAWKSQERQQMLSLGSYWKGQDAQHFDDNFIFIKDDGTMMYHTTPYLTLKRFIKRYNEAVADPALYLPDIRLHDLRHTCASILVAEGENIKEISHKLGHAKPSTTYDIYVGYIGGEQETSDVLERVLS